MRAPPPPRAASSTRTRRPRRRPAPARAGPPGARTRARPALAARLPRSSLRLGAHPQRYGKWQQGLGSAVQAAADADADRLGKPLLRLDVPRVLPGAAVVEVAERELGQGWVIEDHHRVRERIAVGEEALTDDETSVLAGGAELDHHGGERDRYRRRERRRLRDELEARGRAREEQ